MGCGRVVGRFRFRIAVTSAVDMWEPIGQPLVIVGGHALDYALTISRVTGSVSTIAATAMMTAREDMISSVEPAGGTRATAQGTTHHVTDLSAVTDKFLALPGVVARLTNVAQPGYVAGTLSVILQACGTMVGTRSIEVSPQATSQPQFFPIGRVPAAGADKLRAAIVSNAAKDIEYRFHIRKVIDPDEPGDWTPNGSWAPLKDGNSAICTPDAPVGDVAAGSHQVELALALRTKASATSPSGFMRVAAGLSYH
jgi:hypothetical protein